jgi:hypothetical protein
MWIEVFELTQKQEEEDFYSLTDCNVVKRYFLTMDSFAPYTDYDGLEYTSFYSGGMEWISWLSLQEFMDIYINPKQV